MSFAESRDLQNRYASTRRILGLLRSGRILGNAEVNRF
jgi:hypothetical protein